MLFQILKKACSPKKKPNRDSERNTIINLLTITYKPIIDCKSIYRNDMLNEYYNLVPFLYKYEVNF